MEEGRANLVPRLQQDAYMHDLAAAQPAVALPHPYALQHLDQYVCLYSGCEASFSTSELLEEHGGVHAISDTSRLAQNNFAVDTAYNDNPAVTTKSNTYTPPFPSIADSSEGHFSASFKYSGLPYLVGDDLSAVNNYDSNSYAPYTVINPRAQGPPAARFSNKHVAASFDRSNPLSFAEDLFFAGHPHDFGMGSVDLIGPARAGIRNGDISATHWYYPDPSRYIEQPFAADAAYAGRNTFLNGSTVSNNGQTMAESPFPTPSSTGNNTLLTGPSVYTKGQAVAENLLSTPASIGNITLLAGPSVYTNGQAVAENPLPLPIPASNTILVPVDIGPPIPPRPMCTECNQTFGRQSDLERHAKIHQVGPKDFQCQVANCTYSSNRKDKFDEHVKRRHPSAGTA